MDKIPRLGSKAPERNVRKVSVVTGHPGGRVGTPGVGKKLQVKRYSMKNC